MERRRGETKMSVVEKRVQRIRGKKEIRGWDDERSINRKGE